MSGDADIRSGGRAAGRGRRLARELVPPAAAKLVRRARRHQAPHVLAEIDREVRSDRFLEGARHVIGGFLNWDHYTVAAFDYAIRNMPPGGAILEIGSWLGLSTNYLVYLNVRRGRNAPVYNCDPWIILDVDEPIEGWVDINSPEYREYAKESYIRNTEIHAGEYRPHTIEAPAGEFLAMWAAGARATDVFGREAQLGGPIAFAYVDGDHSYEAARRDFEGVDAHLLSGGFLLLDDSAPGPAGLPDVTHLAGEVEADARYELVCMTPHYFFRKR